MGQSSFWLWMSKFNADDITGFTAIVLGCGVAAVFIICYTIYLIHKNRAEVELKRELLDRGLSADEIATIIRATPPKCLPRGWTKG
jgi:hypothetical protein